MLISVIPVPVLIMRPVEKMTADHDIIIIGAGICGINSAYHVQTELPHYSYIILESRNAIGGTWDLFRYPGVRSDSDLFTLGFYWNPWKSDELIVEGQAIQNYIKESAENFGIAQKIRFRHRFLSGDWNSDRQRWALTIDKEGETQVFTAKFLIMSTGYFDYDEPMKAVIPGIENFKGKLVHTQFWPQDLDYTNKNVVIIGSGATAITLLPAMAEKVSSITMLQRSPTYIISRTRIDSHATILQKYLPIWLSGQIIRFKYIVLSLIMVYLCVLFPTWMRKLLRHHNERLLPKHIAHNPHFTPLYNPWEQRMCVCPDNDFFDALYSGKAHVVTDSIEAVMENGIRTKHGTLLDADIIITATGLKLQLFGGARILIDGKTIDMSKKFFWRSSFVQDIPNAVVVIGSMHTSWTLGADITASQVCRILKNMETNRLSSVVPKVSQGVKLEPIKVPESASTYLKRGITDLPKTGDKGPWMGRMGYISDRWSTDYGSFSGMVKELKFVKENFGK